MVDFKERGSFVFHSESGRQAVVDQVFENGDFEVVWADSGNVEFFEASDQKQFNN